MLNNKYHFISILILFLSFCFKMKAQNTYDDLRTKYKIYEQNDERALPVVRLFIN